MTASTQLMTHTPASGMVRPAHSRNHECSLPGPDTTCSPRRHSTLVLCRRQRHPLQPAWPGRAAFGQLGEQQAQRQCGVPHDRWVQAFSVQCKPFHVVCKNCSKGLH
jgi:hypothetical protein